MSAQHRLGVIGCGTIAQIMHIPNILDTPGLELVAISDVYKPVLNAVGDRYNVARRFTDYHELLAQDDIDAVVICHSGSHRESVIAALDADKHILVEKPLAWNLREVEEVAQEVKSSDRVVQLAYHKLYDPGFAYAKEQVDQMDDLAYVECKTIHAADEFNKAPYPLLRGKDEITQFQYDLPDFLPYSQAIREGLAGGDLAAQVDEALGNRKDDPTLRLAYGLLIISVIHQVYTLYGFLGEVKRVIHTEFWREGMSMHVLAEFAGGVRCAINWQYLPYLNHYHEEYGFYGNNRRVKFTLPGPYYRNFPSPVTVQGGEGELSWEKNVTVSYREAFHNELLAFIDNIKQSKTPISSVDDAVKHTTFIQRIIDAAK